MVKNWQSLKKLNRELPYDPAIPLLGISIQKTRKIYVYNVHSSITHSNPKRKQSKYPSTDEWPVLWPPHAKSWLTGKDSDAGRDWGQEEKGTKEDEMAGWHHWLDRHGSEWTPGVGDGQGGLECCDSWGRKESDTTERLNWTDKWINKIFIWQNIIQP